MNLRPITPEQVPTQSIAFGKALPVVEDSLGAILRGVCKCAFALSLKHIPFTKFASEQIGLHFGMLRSFPSLWRKQPLVFKCGLAVLSVAIAVLLTSLLERFMDTIPLFYAAVIVSSWYGGRWSGLLSVLLATLAVDYYFVPPSHRFTLSIATIPYLGSFALLALIVSFLKPARHHAEESLRQAHDEMEGRF